MPHIAPAVLRAAARWNRQTSQRGKDLGSESLGLLAIAVLEFYTLADQGHRIWWSPDDAGLSRGQVILVCNAIFVPFLPTREVSYSFEKPTLPF